MSLKRKVIVPVGGMRGNLAGPARTNNQEAEAPPPRLRWKDGRYRVLLFGAGAPRLLGNPAVLRVIGESHYLPDGSKVEP